MVAPMVIPIRLGKTKTKVIAEKYRIQPATRNFRNMGSSPLLLESGNLRTIHKVEVKTTAVAKPNEKNHEPKSPCGFRRLIHASPENPHSDPESKEGQRAENPKKPDG